MNDLGYHEDGPRRGIPLVLLHAFPFDHRMFHAMIDDLSDVRTIAFDAPGFADSATGTAENLFAKSGERARRGTGARE